MAVASYGVLSALVATYANTKTSAIYICAALFVVMAGVVSHATGALWEEECLNRCSSLVLIYTTGLLFTLEFIVTIKYFDISIG